MLLNFKNSRVSYRYYASLRNIKLSTIKRSLSDVNKTNAPNLDTHKPEEIQHKWYELWQKKLKEFNEKVKI